MAQYARPTSDVSINSWTTAPLYQKIDETLYSDADYIQRNAIAYCEVGLSSLNDPATSDGHYVRYRLGRSRIDRALTIVVRLYQGSTEIALWTHTDPALSFVGFEEALTANQANAITDYSNLRLRFDITVLQNSQVYGQVSWAELEVPDAATEFVYGGSVPIAATLAYASKVDAAYGGTIAQALMPNYLSALDTVYGGLSALGFVPSGLYSFEEAVGEFVWPGNISIEVLPSYLSALEKGYQGQIGLDALPAYSSARDAAYIGAVPLLVLPSYLAGMEKGYDGYVPLAVIPSALYSLEGFSEFAYEGLVLSLIHI